MKCENPLKNTLELLKNVFPGIFLFAIIMFITIQKTLQLYYKQKLVIQELTKTKEELAAKSKDIENLEKENIEISQKAHTLDHKQKSLAKKIDSTFLNYGTITFIIGSSFGLHEDVKRRANYKLSVSKLTFPHGLFRGILLEQIYRSFKILNNETYHK